MRPKSPKYLEDIREAAAFILSTMNGITLADYRENRLVRSAVERNFEIIGEAVRRLVQYDPDTAKQIGDYPHIIAFRNLLAHGYDLVDDERVWKTIREDLPSLLDKVTSLLPKSKGTS